MGSLKSAIFSTDSFLIFLKYKRDILLINKIIMASTFAVEPPSTGFQFDNVKRNAFLAKKGLVTPKTTKTGTTICGAIFDGGVVLGADTRSTSGDIVAYLVLAGADVEGRHLYTIHAHGSTDKIPYTAMGSGMLAATAVLENGWKPNMTEEEAKKLVRDAIAAGIINDMGSGSNVDLAIIKPNDDCKILRPYDVLQPSGQKKKDYTYPKGTTAILDTKIFEIETTVTPLVEPMGT